MWSDLSATQHDWVIREFCRAWLAVYARGQGESRMYDLPGFPSGAGAPASVSPDGASPSNSDGAGGGPGTITGEAPAPLLPDGSKPQFRIKCVLSPTLSDLCFKAFKVVVVDEGVRMKSDDTLLGLGLRQMDPAYRLVLTATPVKNRLPDIFWLAWWACGGRAEAHARWPYKDDPSEREAFASTFMVTENNLTKAAKLAAVGKQQRMKRTAEVCQIHRLWKLLAPVHLRRRKDETGLDLPPKIRRVLRVVPGTQQRRVYQYHLDADYRDVNDTPAVVAQLQALRVAAADPSSPLLTPVAGGADEPCPKCQAKGTLSVGGKVQHCPTCSGRGRIPLPCRSQTAYIPKIQAALTLVGEIIERQEQVVVFSAFNHPLDTLAKRLRECNVRHVLLDGRTSQKKRGVAAAKFKAGRRTELPNDDCRLPIANPPSEIGNPPSEIENPPFDPGIPVMLAGVECMAEGHSFHLANNVILIAYSWAYDKFIQGINRVHRINSKKPINVYVVLVDGTIDAKLESLIQEKQDAAELVLDGRLLGERSEEVNLAELLNIARRNFKEGSKLETMDELALERQWPSLRQRLSTAAARWDGLEAKIEDGRSKTEVHPPSSILHPPSPTRRVPVQAVAPPLPVNVPIGQRPAIPAWLQRARSNAAALAAR